MNKSLHELELDYLKLMGDIELAEGELTEDIEERLNINEEDLESKFESYRYYLDKLAGDVVSIKDRVDAYKVRLANRLNIIKRLKDNLKNAVELCGVEGKSGNKILDFGYAKYYTTNRTGLHFENEDEFYDKDYMRFRLTEPLSSINIDKVIDLLRVENNQDIKYKGEINKKQLLADLKNDVEIDGVEIVTNSSLTIK